MREPIHTDPRPLLTRRDLLRFGAAVSIGGTIAGTVACSTRTPLRVGVRTWSGYHCITLAKKQGWYEKEALQLVPMARADLAREALRRGDIDAATMTLGAAVRLHAQGVPLQVVLVCDVSAGEDVVMARPDLASLAALKGRRIGVETTTTLGIIMLAEVLRVARLRRADVEVVPIGEDHFDAWQRGGLDAVLTYGPLAEQLGAHGLVRLVDSRNLRPLIMGVVAARTDRLAGHESALRALVAGHFRARQVLQGNSIDASYVLASLVGSQPQHVRRTCVGLDLPDVADNRRELSAPAASLTGAARDLGGLMVDAGLLDRIPATDGLFTPRFLPEARI
jgi:NitT/TauT family transport system substrate-binding protein